LADLHERYASETEKQLSELQKVALHNGNLFEALMEACKFCSLGQITSALFNVGGQYRRNM
jgi:methylmalonyl-CoA mutase